MGDNAISNDNDGFIQVKSKRNKMNKNKINGNKNGDSLTKNLNEINKNLESLDLNEEFDEKKVDKMQKTIENYQQKLLNEDKHNYLNKFKQILNEYIKSYEEINKSTKIIIRVYGLGSIDHNMNSRYQFVLLLRIIDELNSLANVESVQLYDPLFTLFDKHLLTNVYKFTIIESNEEAKCKINDKKYTFVYMPHCGKPLYNNLLYSNWNSASINYLLLFGNSFNTINTLTLEDNMANYYKYIKECLKFLNEYKIASDCEFTNAFNDLTFHKFSPNLCNYLFDDTFITQPVYQDDDEIVFSS